MPSFLDRIAKSWRDAARDVVLIVVSILIAFALDAWWEGRGERRMHDEQIATLKSEFVAARHRLASTAEGLERSAQATIDILAMMGPRAPSPDEDRLAMLLQHSLNFGIAAPSHTALDAALAFGNPKLTADETLAVMLNRWPEMMEDLEGDAQHLERNRDQDLQAALTELGIPGFAAAALPTELGLPPSSFPSDAGRIVRSVKVYAALYYRALRIRVLSSFVEVALERADEILEQLDGLLPDGHPRAG